MCQVKPPQTISYDVDNIDIRTLSFDQIHRINEDNAKSGRPELQALKSNFLSNAYIDILMIESSLISQNSPQKNFQVDQKFHLAYQKF
jgi:hypothetical protein